MITDDPGTPGNGKWENNFAITFEHRPGETAYDVPEIDLNYEIFRILFFCFNIFLDFACDKPADVAEKT